MLTETVFNGGVESEVNRSCETSLVSRLWYEIRSIPYRTFNGMQDMALSFLFLDWAPAEYTAQTGPNSERGFAAHLW